jgi:hypothetical protein
MAITRTYDDVYVDASPRDLWRLGNATSARLDHARIPKDIRSFTRLFSDGRMIPYVHPDGGGISVFDRPNPAMAGKHWWRIPKGAVLALGLKITRDHRYGHGITHFTISPTHALPLRLYLLKLVILSRNAQYQKVEVGHGIAAHGQ